MITAVTGGIGSGKSYFCDLLRKQGIEVYDCDSQAKRLMMESEPLQKALSGLVGMDLFHDGQMDKQTLKEFITQSKENACMVDDIVHPAVAEDFRRSGCLWLESAILFESGFNQRIRPDLIICVTAPLEVRIERIRKRDRCTRAQAIQWINAQMPQEEKARMSDYVLVNDGTTDLEEQINILIKQPTSPRV